jgi:hypothetical protein
VLLHVVEEVPQLRIDDYREGIALRRMENASLAEVSFTHPDGEVSRRVVEAATGYVLDQTSRRPLDQAQQLLESTEARLADAERAMDEFIGHNGVYDPETEYRAVIDEIDAIEAHIASLTIDGGDEDSLSYLDERALALLDEKERLGLALSRYLSLDGELELARASVEEARAVYDEVRVEYQGANSPQSLILRRETVVVHDETERLQRTPDSWIGTSGDGSP